MPRARSPALNEDAIRVEEVCTRLARRGLFVKAEGPAQWPDGTVTQRCGFIHGLYQAITYERIGVARRAQWHQRIGERLEAPTAGEPGPSPPSSPCTSSEDGT